MTALWNFLSLYIYIYFGYTSDLTPTSIFRAESSYGPGIEPEPTICKAKYLTCSTIAPVPDYDFLIASSMCSMSCAFTNICEIEISYLDKIA